jgi:hypothetical protein
MGSSIGKSKDKGGILITITRRKDGWVSGTYEVIGCFDKCKYEAKVYDSGSKYGINGGRVSKMCVWREKKKAGNIQKTELLNYDRGWDIQANSEDEKKMFSVVLSFLEKLPTETFEESA